MSRWLQRESAVRNAVAARLFAKRVDLLLDGVALLLQSRQLVRPTVDFYARGTRRSLAITSRFAGYGVLQLGDLSVERRKLCLQPSNLIGVPLGIASSCGRARGGLRGLRCGGADRRNRGRTAQAGHVVVGPDLFRPRLRG